MKVKTEELIGPALDWAVTRANFEINFDEVWRNFRSECEYSADWAQGGPIIERERIEIRGDGNDGWLADDYIHGIVEGQTPLIAAMRCYVASKMGDEVEIPEELIK
jgi:hypothetical protein